MRKVILILLVFVSAKVSAQVYQEMPQYGYRANRMAFDSTLQIPTVCGVPTLKSIVKANKNGAIAYDSCNARFYTYNPTTQTWTAITGGGGGSTDTTSLSNRINLKIDSLKRISDSVFAFRNGTRVFQFKDSLGAGSIDTTNQFVKRLTRTEGKDSIIFFVGANRFAIKDSVGGAGTIPTLQQVTTAGSTTTSEIYVGNYPNKPHTAINAEAFSLSGISQNTNYENGQIITDVSLTLDTFKFATNIPSNIATIPISVNGIKANANGNITISTNGVAVDTIFRTLGKDSIFYKKNNITYAIKDSVGSGSIDTTNQFVKRLDRTPGKDSIIYFVGANRFAIKDSIGVAGSGSQYFVSKWSNSTTLENSQIFDSVNVGINTSTPDFKLDVNGTARVSEILNIERAEISGIDIINTDDNFRWSVRTDKDNNTSNVFSISKFTGTQAVPFQIYETGNVVLQGNLDEHNLDSNYRLDVYGKGRFKDTLFADEGLVIKKLATNGADKMVTVDSLGSLKTQVIPSGGSSDTIYTENPIMFISRNDSNIVFFNADTANVWRGSGGGVAVDTIFRTLGKDSIFYKKNNITYAIKDSVGTNPPASGYYGAFQDTTTQTAASINTAYGVKLGVTDLSNGVTISNNTRIKIANAGIYNIQFSLQLEKTGSGNMIADIWLRKNGVNLNGTTGKVVLTGSANASPIVAAWNYLVAVSSNDSLELMWSTTNDNVVIKASPATAPFPSIPSAILTVTQQSGIMAGTGISPLDTANMLSNYARTNLVNTKLNISDTSTLQPKSIPSYTFLANNTDATANAQALPFKDTSGVYTQSPTWNNTAPTSGNLSYRWTRIGRMVTINISLIYAVAGANNSILTVPLPTGAPTPTKPAGLTSALNNLYPITGSVNLTSSSTLTNSATRGFLRNNTNNDGFEFILNFSNTAAAINAHITCTYFTD